MKNTRALVSAMLCLLLADAAIAQPQRGGGTPVELSAPLPPPPPPPPMHPRDDRVICWHERGTQSDRCRPTPYPYRRPAFVAPVAPSENSGPAASDWEGCRQEKLKQLNALRYGDTSRANRLDEWLWKNCRSFSNELRQLEQDAM